MNGLIDGVSVTDLKVIKDERGAVWHMLRAGNMPFFEPMGEVYFSMVRPNVVKAWHCHKAMRLNYCCVVGEIQLGLVDLRLSSPTFGIENTIYLSDGMLPNYKLVSIPPLVWNGFRSLAINNNSALMANMATLPHDPEEIVRVHPREFPVDYYWGDYEIAG